MQRLSAGVIRVVACYHDVVVWRQYLPLSVLIPPTLSLNLCLSLSLLLSLSPSLPPYLFIFVLTPLHTSKEFRSDFGRGLVQIVICARTGIAREEREQSFSFGGGV